MPDWRICRTWVKKVCTQQQPLHERGQKGRTDLAGAAAQDWHTSCAPSSSSQVSAAEQASASVAAHLCRAWFRLLHAAFLGTAWSPAACPRCLSHGHTLLMVCKHGLARQALLLSTHTPGSWP